MTLSTVDCMPRPRQGILRPSAEAQEGRMGEQSPNCTLTTLTGAMFLSYASQDSQRRKHVTSA